MKSPRQISGATTNGPLAPAAFDNLLNGAYAGALQVWKSLSGWSAKSLGMSIVDGAYILASALARRCVAFIIFMAMHVLLGLCIADWSIVPVSAAVGNRWGGFSTAGSVPVSG